MRWGYSQLRHRVPYTKFFCGFGLKQLPGFTNKESRGSRKEWFIDGQAFSRSYDLAHRPTPSQPPPPTSKVDQRHSGRLRKRDELRMERGEVDGRRAESYYRKKASISNAILSGGGGSIVLNIRELSPSHCNLDYNISGFAISHRNSISTRLSDKLQNQKDFLLWMLWGCLRGPVSCLHIPTQWKD
jgi:hypothetical protein